jgi:hypothetical protein
VNTSTNYSKVSDTERLPTNRTLGGGSSDQSEATGPVSIQVWVDTSNLLRRLATVVKQNMGPPGQVESLTLSVDFTNYGEPVHIEPPPPSLVLPNS